MADMKAIMQQLSMQEQYDENAKWLNSQKPFLANILIRSKDKQALQKKFAETKGLQFPLIADTETTSTHSVSNCHLDSATISNHVLNLARDGYESDRNRLCVYELATNWART